MMKSKVGVLSWAVVTLVGVIVVVLVLALSLFPRLSAAQNLLNGLSPVFTADRVAGDRASINTLSKAVDLVDPVVTPQGGAADEVPKLLGFVSQQTGLTVPQVLGALEKSFPHTAALLQAIPFSAVASEINPLVTFVATTLKLTPDQVLAALKTNFPHLYQAIVNIGPVTSGWNNVPGTQNLTRFNGSPVNTVPQVRDYFSDDVIPVLERQQQHFTALAGSGGVGFLAILLLVVGIIVIVYGVLMMYLSGAGLGKNLLTAAWSVVSVVGALVVVLVLALSLFPRLNGGQNVLDEARPAFTADRVAGDRAAINFVGTVVNFADPAVTEAGGGAAEVPKLIAFLSQQTGLTQAQVLTAMQTNFPHTTALLQSLPLSSVASEITPLVNFLATTLKLTPAQVLSAVQTNFPHLYQAITNLGPVTSAWDNVPGTAKLTRFDGSPVHTVPQVAAYFSGDVITAVEQQRANFQEVDTTAPRLPFFPPLLLIVGIVVIIYGLLMIIVVRRTGPATTAVAATV